MRRGYFSNTYSNKYIKQICKKLNDPMTTPNTY